MRVSYRFLAAAATASKLPWRQSASLMIASPVGSNGQIKFLMMQRSKESRFMPGATVFPGGAKSAADGSQDWCKLYSEAGIDLMDVQILSDTANRPFIYRKDYPQYSPELLPNEIALRITSIREAFEECGVLLCKPMGSFTKTKSEFGSGKQLFDDESLIVEWQKKVYHNPTQFLTMCHELKILPDILALSEWSNWLTPTSMTVRFDTVFYVTVVEGIRNIYIDKGEAASANWERLSDLIDEQGKATALLQPPQYYELARMRNIKTAEELLQLIDLRRRHGIERWLPVLMKCKDGILHLLPGDDFYPQQHNDTDYQEWAEVDMTLDETARQCKNFNRSSRYQSESGKLVIKTSKEPRYGHYYSVGNS